jgi:hypothetical protein
MRRQIWCQMPGLGPAPRLRRRVIAIVPRVSRARRLRWQAGTLLPGVGPTARVRRRSRAVATRRNAVIGTAGLAGTGAAATAVAKRRSRRQSHDQQAASAP